MNIQVSEDADLFVKTALRHPIAYSGEIMATYHQDDVNRACLVKRRTGEPALSCTVRQAMRTGLVPPDKIKDLQEYAALHQLAAANDLLMAEQKAKALELLNLARRTRKYQRCWLKLTIMALFPPRVAHYGLPLWEKISKKLG